MPDEVEAAVAVAVADEEVKVIVVRGAGRSFCGGYDFGGGFELWNAAITERDGPFGDYSQAPADERPDPRNVIEP